MMDTVSMEKLVSSYITAWNSQDASLLSSLLSSDASYWNANTSGLLSKSLPDMWRQMSSRYSDLKMDMLSLSWDKDRAILEWTLSWTDKGMSKKMMQLSGVDILSMIDGKIVSLKSYFDQSHLVLR